MTTTPSQPKALLGLKALLCVPTYGPTDPLGQKDLRIAVMSAANHGLSWVGDVSPDRMGYSAARNAAAQSLLDEGEGFADGIMWVDSDMRPSPGDIASLIGAARHYKEDFVTGVYHQRCGEMAPVLYEYQPRRKVFRQIIDYPEGAFSPMGGCGFGFVWTSYKLISAIADHKDFKPDEGWFPDRRDVGGFGEDLSFCFQAIQAGFQLYVNTAVQPGHMGEPRTIYKKDYVESRSKIQVEVKAERESKKWGRK